MHRALMALCFALKCFNGRLIYLLNDVLEFSYRIQYGEHSWSKISFRHNGNEFYPSTAS